MDVLEHPVITEPDEAAARRTLREQIGRLERDLGTAVCAAYPRVAHPPARHPRHAGPRMLGLGELEALRDDLAERVRVARGDLSAQAERQEAKRS